MRIRRGVDELRGGWRGVGEVLWGRYLMYGEKGTPRSTEEEGEEVGK